MSAFSCPKCGASHSGATDKAGWATCSKCANCWQPNPPAPEVRPTTSKPLRKIQSWGVSDEYAPVESNDQPRTEPLTVREPSGIQKAIELPNLDSSPAPAEPKRRKSKSSGDVQMPADFDSQLFERAERDAQESRAQMETISAPNPVPTPSTEGTLTCPVCGHGFPALGGPSVEHQRCPQCSVLFNLKTGEPVGSDSDDDDDADAIDGLIGSTIRGCFVDRKLGEGGMGTVYHARQLSLDRSVAVKVMPSELARNRNFIQRFEREAKSLARINHPHILHIYDFGEDPDHGIYFMIIEFVDGKDLGEILRTRDVISQEEALDIMRQAMSALEIASEKGVIHRDIKPDNLMIAKDGTCKVSDFGLAKGYGDFSEVTTAGVRVGTPAFMSPEQCDGGDIDARSDVYSLGCTIYLALTGHLPFNGDSPFSIMLKHKTEAPPSLRKYRADANADVDALLQKMLAKRPEDRCVELHDLIGEIQDLQVALAKGVSPVRKGTSGRPRAVDESGAAKLIPDPQVKPLAPDPNDDPNLPLALRNVLGEDASDHQLPSIDLGLPPVGARESVDSSKTTSPPAPVMLVNDLPPLPVDAPPAVGNASTSGRGSTSLSTPGRASERGSANRSSSENLRRPPVSASSSALIHVNQGDHALADGHPSEAIREYNEAQKRRPSKEVGGKLADARKAQRHNEASSLDAHGDAMAQSGRFDEAIDDWMRASQQYSQVARREDLLRKVAKAQSAKRRRRIMRLSVGVIILLAVIGVNAYLWTPRGHAWLVERQRQQANELSDPGARREALSAIIDNNVPFGFYQTCFGRSYAISFAQVEADIKSLSGMPDQGGSETTVANREEAVVKAVETAAVDESITWPALIKRGENALKNLSGTESRARVQVVIDMARARVAEVEQEIASIDSLRAEGRHEEALTRTAQFAADFSRAGAEWSLPTPGRLNITVPGEAPDLSIVVDGVRLVGDQRVFCRDATRPVVIEVTATGFLSERVTVPPGVGDTPVAIALIPGLRWQATVTPSRPWWRLEASGNSIYAIGPASIAVIDPRDGSTRQIFDRRSVPIAPALPNPSWTLISLESNPAVIASSDGLVVRVTREANGNITYQELLKKGSSAVLAWMERELVFQPGRKTQVMIDISARGSGIATYDGPNEQWHNSTLDIKAAKPWLWSLGDRILVVDDAGLRVFEEDGSVTSTYSLGGIRTQPVHVMDNGKLLAISTNEGITLLHIGGQPQFVQVVTKPALENGGPLASATDNVGLVTGDALGVLRLYDVANGGLTPRWQAAIPEMHKASGPLVLSPNVVVAVDDQHVIHLFDRNTGAVTRSYPHPRMISVPPLVLDGQLVVLDVSGALTSYQLSL